MHSSTNGTVAKYTPLTPGTPDMPVMGTGYVLTKYPN